MTKTFKIILLLFLFIYSTGICQTTDTLITISTSKMHFKIIKGKGTPILFEAGNGDDSTVWDTLLQDIYKATGATIITYDRAGLGKSEIDTTRISFKREVKNLKKALKQLGYKNNFFLVAHSFGSFYASEFSKKNKGKITGAVFIDTATPCAFNTTYAHKVKSAISQDNWTLLKQYKTGLYYVLDKFPKIAAYMSNRFISNSIPLTVIAAEIRKPTKAIGETEQDMLNMTNCLKQLGSLPNRKYILAANTEHKIWKSNPELIKKEIIERYKQVEHSKF